MSKWTPGPWFVVNTGTEDEPMMEVKAERIRGRGPTHSVALCATGDSPQEMENANARLIAKAPLLPELVEALRYFVQASASGQWEKTDVARDKAVAVLARYDEATK